MTIYALYMDPETGLIEPEKGVASFRVASESKVNYILENGRRLNKHSGLYQFYATREAASEDRIAHLMYLRRVYKEKLRKIHVLLKRAPVRQYGGGRHKGLLILHRPDGADLIRTVEGAMRETGLSRATLNRMLREGVTTKYGSTAGYSAEWHKISEVNV